MNAKDIAYGYAIGYNDGLSGTPSEKWTRPSDWPDLNAPENNHVTLLYSSLGQTEPVLTLIFRAYSAHSGRQFFSGETSFLVDYGDGNTIERKLESRYHTWTETYTYQDSGGIVLNNGLRVFPVTIAVPDDAYLYFGGGVLEAYIGKDIKFYTNLGAMHTMQHIKTFGWIPDDNNCIYGDTGQFQFMYNLHCFETTVPFTKVPMLMFYQCVNLSSFDFSECTEIGKKAFQNCYSLRSISGDALLKVESDAFYYCYGINSVNAPNLAEIGDNAFYSNYALGTFICSGNCTFGTNCFQNCHNLYPRPD